jgi:N-acetylneuraminate synthase
MSAVEVAGRAVGAGEPVYVVAELSGNHNGELQRALRLVEAAADSGADAVKVQTYRADTMTIDAPQPWFRIEGGTQWDDRTLYDLYEEAAMPWEWQPQLAARARELGVDFFSSPFDEEAVEFLETRGGPADKVASV